MAGKRGRGEIGAPSELETDHNLARMIEEQSFRSLTDHTAVLIERNRRSLGTLMSLLIIASSEDYHEFMHCCVRDR